MHLSHHAMVGEELYRLAYLWHLALSELPLEGGHHADPDVDRFEGSIPYQVLRANDMYGQYSVRYIEHPGEVGYRATQRPVTNDIVLGETDAMIERVQVLPARPLPFQWQEGKVRLLSVDYPYYLLFIVSLEEDLFDP